MLMIEEIFLFLAMKKNFDLELGSCESHYCPSSRVSKMIMSEYQFSP